MEQDIAFLKQNHEALEQQLTLTQKSFTLSAQDYKANQTLFNKKVLSAKDYRAAQNLKLMTLICLPYSSF